MRFILYTRIGIVWSYILIEKILNFGNIVKVIEGVCWHFLPNEASLGPLKKPLNDEMIFYESFNFRGIKDPYGN